MRKVQVSKKVNIMLMGLLMVVIFWSFYFRTQAEDIGVSGNLAETQEMQQETGETNETEDSAEESENGVYNILLIGADRRDDSWAGNSDTMILVSINDEKQQVSMISLMRDTGVDVPGCGTHKLNYAHAYGGADLLLETIEHNYDVPIDRYISVDFESMIDIVDAVGGVELTLSDAEVSNANTNISYMCELQGISADPYLFPCGGTYLCNGMQAVNYARIRYIGNADYERTERQRTVVTRIIEKLKEMSSSELLNFAMKAAMSVTDYNIPMTEMIELVGRASELSEYELVSDRIPYDGLYYSQNEMLMPDWNETIVRLKETIY